jgi:cytoskeletal protein RodZ
MEDYITMKLKKKLLITLSIIVAVLLVSGVSIYAATSYGTSSDPLVTLSYINDVKETITSDAKSYVDSTSKELSASFNSSLSDFTKDINSKLSSGTSHSTADVFTVVTLTSGQSIVCEPGCEIMLRIGSAKASGSDSPVLVDTTTGNNTESGTELTKNHMYMVTITGNGITATGSTTKVLIRGNYTIS